MALLCNYAAHVAYLPFAPPLAIIVGTEAVMARLSSGFMV